MWRSGSLLTVLPYPPCSVSLDLEMLHLLLTLLSAGSSLLRRCRGQVVGVDAMCWMHRGAAACAVELVEGRETDKSEFLPTGVASSTYMTTTTAADFVSFPFSWFVAGMDLARLSRCGLLPLQIPSLLYFDDFLAAVLRSHPLSG